MLSTSSSGRTSTSCSPVVVVHEGGELRREEASSDSVLGKDDRHRAAVHRECGGDLRADEAAADDGHPDSLARELVQAAVVVDRAVVDDALAVVCRKAARGSARRQQQALVGVRLARVVRDRPLGEVRRRDRQARVEVDVEVGRPSPDGALFLPLPERLRQRRARIGRMRLRGEETDRAVRVVVADPTCRRVGRHAAPDDQVPVGRHPPRILDHVALSHAVECRPA